MVRELRPDDFGCILNMLRFIKDESPEYAYTSEDDAEYVLSNLKAMYDTGALLGVIDEAGRGVMIGALHRQWYSSRLDAAEQILFVYPPFRGTPLAVRMIRSFEQIARARGACTLGVGVTTGIREEQTVSMYQRLGYTPKGYSLSKVLCATPLA